MFAANSSIDVVGCKGGAAPAGFKGDKRNKSQTLGVTAFSRVAYKHVCNFSE